MVVVIAVAETALMAEAVVMRAARQIDRNDHF